MLDYLYTWIINQIKHFYEIIIQNVTDQVSDLSNRNLYKREGPLPVFEAAGYCKGCHC